MNFQCENDLVEALINSDEHEIFETEAVMNMVHYKWNTYAFASHAVGCFFHLVYIVSLIAYINRTFKVKRNKDPDAEEVGPPASIVYTLLLGIGLLYPLFYDFRQLAKQGKGYFFDPWNYVDIVHITLGYANLVFQWVVGPRKLSSKIIIIIVVLICLLKTFFFMRIIQKFSFIVTMIMNVVGDL